MKFVFLINNASFLSEFFGKLANQIVKQGDECLVVMSSKVGEYEKKKFFPTSVKFISKVDWCAENYRKEKKEFGSLSWKELFPDFDRFKRVDFSYNNSLDIVSQIYQFFDYIFKEEKPDIVICEPPAGLFHEVAYYFCKKNNVPYIGLNDSIYDGRIDIFDSEFTSLKYEKIFNELEEKNILAGEREFAKDFIDRLVSHKEVHSYVGLVKVHFSQFGIIKHYLGRIKDIGPLLKYAINRRKFKKFDYESEANFRRVITTIWEMEKRQLRITSQNGFFAKIDERDRFFLFPLHFQPETSTSVWATYYCDQLNTIKNIAFALPFPYKLYVKEHPAAVGLRSGSFYRKLQELPNVVLIHANENVEKLVAESMGVVTLTSTIGMEAAFVGKPVYVLGNVFYSYHPMCRPVRGFGELKENIERDLANKPRIDNLEDINCRFVVSCFKNTIAGRVVSASQENDVNNYQSIYQNLKSHAISKFA